jgi:hypothetical protein
LRSPATAAGSDIRKYTNRLTLANGILAQRNEKRSRFRQVSTFEHLVAGPACLQRPPAKNANGEIII